MSGHRVEEGDIVWLYEWIPGQNSHNKIGAVVRTVPGRVHDKHTKIHLQTTETGEDETNQPFRNFNNVDNFEIAAPDGDATGIHYWKYREQPEV